MGIEGIAAKAYFRRLFADDSAERRNISHLMAETADRRLIQSMQCSPFAYTLLGKEITGALEAVGLDPAVGYPPYSPSGKCILSARYAGRTESAISRSICSNADQSRHFYRKKISERKRMAQFL